jgi:hypothetical protein
MTDMKDDNLLAGYSIKQAIRAAAKRNRANIWSTFDQRDAFRRMRRLSNNRPNARFKRRGNMIAKLSATKGGCATDIV